MGVSTLIPMVGKLYYVSVISEIRGSTERRNPFLEITTQLILMYTSLMISQTQKYYWL